MDVVKVMRRIRERLGILWGYVCKARGRYGDALKVFNAYVEGRLTFEEALKKLQELVKAD